MITLKSTILKYIAKYQPISYPKLKRKVSIDKRLQRQRIRDGRSTFINPNHIDTTLTKMIKAGEIKRKVKPADKQGGRTSYYKLTRSN